MKKNYIIIELLGILILPLFLVIYSCQKESTDCPKCPVLEKLTPDRGKGDSIITITGSNFSSDTSTLKVYFNKVTAEILSSSETNIVVKAPKNGTTGPVTITRLATDTRGSELLESTNNLTFIYAGTLSSFTPQWGAYGTEVRIKGTSFGNSSAGNEIIFGYNTNIPKIAIIKSWSDTVIVAIVPQGAQTGQIAVKFGNTSILTDNEFVYEYTGTLSDFINNGSSTISDIEFDDFNNQLLILSRKYSPNDTTQVSRVNNLSQISTIFTHPRPSSTFLGQKVSNGYIDYNNNIISVDPNFGHIFISGSSKSFPNAICLRYYDYYNTTNPYYSGGTGGLFTSFIYNTIGNESTTGKQVTSTGGTLFTNIKSIAPGIDKNGADVMYILDNDIIDKMYNNTKGVEFFLENNVLSTNGILDMNSICTDKDGNIYISSSNIASGGQNFLHKSNNEGTIITKLCGGPTAAPKDGDALTVAKLSILKNLTYDGDYNIYFTEQNATFQNQGACTIRKYNIKTGIISNVAGTYGVPSPSTFSTNIVGLAFDKKKNILYIADASNNKIKKIEFK